MQKALIALMGTLTFLVSTSFQETQIRVDVEAVNLFVTVIDKRGAFVTDVTQERFIVYEDGIPQEITFFSRETDIPLRIGLLVDTSSSVRLQLEFEKEAATHFLRSVMQRRDQALLVEFDEGVDLLHDFTRRPSAIIEKIQNLKAGGGTALWDAIYTVAREKMTQRDARKTLVIISDGVDVNSQRTIEETLPMVQASEVTTYSIGTNKFAASGNKRGEENLIQLAQETGGRAFFPFSTQSLESAFDQINQELRSQYSVSYTPRNKERDGKFRKIEVRITDGKDLNLRHRRGYWAPTQAPSD